MVFRCVVPLTASSVWANADLLYAFSTVPRDLNFMDHRADSEDHHVVVLDQNLLQSTNAEISFSSWHREKPDAFELFRGSALFVCVCVCVPAPFLMTDHGQTLEPAQQLTVHLIASGSPCPVLSRAFVEHCVAAPDNLPRTLLMYFSNTLEAKEFYFQTVMANSPRFRNSTVNHSVRVDVPPPQAADQQARYDALVSSGAAFAERLGDDEALLQRIDEEVLRRPLDGITPGEWCTAGGGEDSAGECSVGGDIDAVRLGAAGRRLASLMAGLVGTGSCGGCNS